MSHKCPHNSTESVTTNVPTTLQKVLQGCPPNTGESVTLTLSTKAGGKPGHVTRAGQTAAMSLADKGKWGGVGVEAGWEEGGSYLWSHGDGARREGVENQTEEV